MQDLFWPLDMSRRFHSRFTACQETGRSDEWPSFPARENGIRYHSGLLPASPASLYFFPMMNQHGYPTSCELYLARIIDQPMGCTRPSSLLIGTLLRIFLNNFLLKKSTMIRMLICCTKCIFPSHVYFLCKRKYMFVYPILCLNPRGENRYFVK
jgi:hypothetical protein